MEEKGIVRQIMGETMTVEFERSPMCEKCGECERAREKMLMEMKRSEDAQIGDLVEVELSEGTLLKASVLAYGVPLVLLLAGLFLGKQLAGWLGLSGNGDLYALGLGALLAALGFLAIRLTEPGRRKHGGYMPQVKRIYKEQTQESEDE